MDGFQIRLELLHLLKYLNASQQSIQKVLTFAMKHASKAEDVWSCIVSQCEKVSRPLSVFGLPLSLCVYLLILIRFIL